MKSEENLQGLLDKLQNNINGLGSLEAIKQRYPRAFNNLISQIKTATSEMYREYILCALRPMGKMSVDEHTQMQKQIQGILNRPKMRSLATQILQSVLLSRNADDVYALGSCAYVTILNEVYKPYWLHHIHMQNGQYYSDLIEMWYEPSSSTWTNGKEYSFLYPPTREEFEKEIAPALAVCDKFFKDQIQENAPAVAQIAI